MSASEAVSKASTHDFYSAEISFPLNTFKPAASFGVHV